MGDTVIRGGSITFIKIMGGERFINLKFVLVGGRDGNYTLIRSKTFAGRKKQKEQFEEAILKVKKFLEDAEKDSIPIFIDCSEEIKDLYK